ncbi:MAG TPA: hypothetical protein VJ810_07515 [Blastocatellia bacterium]|nr:hypothetical protein [Blastocatellia bacterium]
MDFSGSSELIAQALIARVALEALSVVTMVMFCASLMAFVVYLVGVWRLCRAEYRLSK